MDADASRLEEKVRLSKHIIAEALDRFERVAAAFSGGKDSLVMTRLILDVCEEEGYEQPIFIVSDPVPIPENDEYVRRIIREWGIKRYVFYRDLIKPEHLEKAKPIAQDKARCCYWLKVVPLNEFIRDNKIEALIVAIRWDEHPERAKEKYFSPRENPPHTRVHPMLHWTWLDIWEYIKQRNLPFNPLYLKGYTSLGCAPCTRPVKPDGFKSIDEIIEWVRAKKAPERAGRDIDKERIMEKLRKMGYF